jgi:hypothetical protein
MGGRRGSLAVDAGDALFRPDEPVQRAEGHGSIGDVANRSTPRQGLGDGDVRRCRSSAWNATSSGS